MLNAPDAEKLEGLNVPACPEEADEVAEVLHVQPEVLTSLETANETEPPRKFDIKVLAATAVLHFLPTARIATFRDYARKVFLPFLKNQLNSAKHLDMVWGVEHVQEKQHQRNNERKERERSMQKG